MRQLAGSFGRYLAEWEVSVRIDESGQHRSAGEVDDLGCELEWFVPESTDIAGSLDQVVRRAASHDLALVAVALDQRFDHAGIAPTGRVAE